MKLKPPADKTEKLDIVIPDGFRLANVYELKCGTPFIVELKTTEEYIAEFNKLNHLKE